MYFFFYYEPYIALLGHLNTDEDYETAQKALKSINKKYQKELVQSCTLVQKNEFHGLLRQGSVLMNLIQDFEEAVCPAGIRWGIGIGKSSPEKQPASSWEARSAAFQNAQDAWKFLREQNNRNASFTTDYYMVCSGDHEEVTHLINTIFMLITSLKKGWTRHQREVITDYMKYGGGQAKAAKRLGITQSSVQKSLAGGGYYTYQEVMDTLNEIFSQIGERKEYI